MSASSQVSDILARWEDGRRKGRNLSPEELCAGRAELLPEVRRQIEAQRSMEAKLGMVPAAAGSRSTPAGVSSVQPGTGGQSVAPAAASPVQERPVVPGYEIVEELGRGGMGVVYKARHVALKRLVALKMILSGAHGGPQQRARFRAEAEAVARLQHPHIVQVFGVGEHEGHLFIALEFVAGGSLEGKLAGTPLPVREAAQLAETLARAMHHAHQQGIVHRDLKPPNVLLTKDGTPKITDFGLAKQFEGGAGQTHTGEILGTPSYMAPEQALGQAREIRPHTDVYALGAILYESLTGRPPFKGETAMDTLLQVASEEPVPPSRLQPKTPRNLETICLKCLEKDPRRRYPGAGMLADDLHRFLADKPITARPISGWERALKWAKRRPALASLFGVIGAAALLLLAMGLGSYAAVSSALNESRTSEAAAKQARDDERKQRERAEERERIAYRRLYTSDMVLAQQYWQEGQIRRILEILEFHRPREGRQDLRGFEWYRAWKLCHGDLATLRGHSDGIRRVAFSPDGKLLASASSDQTVKLWDVITRREVATLAGHTSRVTSVAFSSKGRILVTGAEDHTLKLWEVATRRERRTLRGHTASITEVAFSGDGRLIASTGLDKTVRLWDAETAEPLAVLTKEGLNRIFSVAFSPDGKHLVVAAEMLGGGRTGYLVLFWDVATRTLNPDCSGYEALIESVRFSPDGRRLAVALRNGNVDVWDPAKMALKEAQPEEKIAAHRDVVSSVAFAPDGSGLATVGWDMSIKLFQTGSKQPRAVYKGHTGWILSVAFSPDGRLLATGSRDGTVKLWDSTPEPEHVLLRTRAAQPGRPPQARSSTISIDCRTCALGLDSGHVGLYDLQTGRERNTFLCHPLSVLAVALSTDGKKLATGSFREKPPHDKPARFWDVATGRELATLPAHTDPVRFVAIAPNGTTLATGSDDGIVKLWDQTTDRTLAQFSFPGDDQTWVGSGEFSPDGSLLAVGQQGREGVVKVYDVATRRERITLPGQRTPVYSLGVSPDNTRIATGCGDQTVRLWDIATGRELATLRGHTGVVFSVAFSPDGKRLASAGSDGVVKLWDALTGEERGNLLAQRGAIVGLRFSPDSGQLLVLDHEGTVVFLRAASEAEAAAGSSLQAKQ